MPHVARSVGQHPALEGRPLPVAAEARQILRIQAVQSGPAYPADRGTVSLFGDGHGRDPPRVRLVLEPCPRALGRPPPGGPVPSEIRRLMAYLKMHVVARRTPRSGRSPGKYLAASAALRVPARRGRRAGRRGGPLPARKVAGPVVAVLRLAQVRVRSMLVFAYSARRLLELKDAAQR